MTKTKIWLITAAALILIGAILFVGIMMALKWDFGKLSTTQFESNNYSIEEAFKSISINSTTADIVLTVTQDEKPLVICFEETNIKHTVSVKDGTLVIAQMDSRKWYDHIGLFTYSPKITVCLPEGAYNTLSITESTGDIEIGKEFSFETMDITLTTGDVTNYAAASNIKIKTTTGDIKTENISADQVVLSVSTGDVTVRSVACKGNLNISVSTGDVKLTDAVCNELLSTGNTGDITLRNVTADESLSITRTTGDVKLESCDAGALSIQTDTGDVTGSLLSEKIFITESHTGDVDVPNTAAGGICEITTSTGDILISVE